MIVKCKACGNKFITKYNAKKFCDEICRKNYAKHLKESTKYKCALCGKEFAGKRKYCSPECRQKANGRMKDQIEYNNNKTIPKYSLIQVSKLAKELGISYGKCVARFGL